MATSGPRRCSPELPAELVRAVFSSPPLRGSDKDRLRCHAVCKSWRAALLDLPFPNLRLDHDIQLSKLNWMLRSRPAFEGVEVYVEPQGLLPALLDSIACEALRMLELRSMDICVPKALPHPAAFPNLEHLGLVLDAAQPAVAGWLPRLAELGRLRSLELTFSNGQAPQPVVLPPLAGLTSLRIGAFQPTAVHVPLRALCSLQTLHLRSGGRVDLTAGSGAGGVAGQLTSLSLYCSGALTVDFAAMPALVLLDLDSANVVGARTVAAAEGLSRLELGGGLDSPDVALGPWASELLSHAPRSLRVLGLWGYQPEELENVLGGLGQLRVLFIGSHSPDPVPPPGAPLWAGLRSLQLLHFSEASPSLPEALRGASCLERLAFWSEEPSAADIDVLVSLPALRHVTFEGLAEETAVATLCAARAALPKAEVQAVEELQFDTFVKEALGALPGSAGAAPQPRVVA